MGNQLPLRRGSLRPPRRNVSSRSGQSASSAYSGDVATVEDLPRDQVDALVAGDAMSLGTSGHL
jgi:hypothetical protein